MKIFFQLTHHSKPTANTKLAKINQWEKVCSTTLKAYLSSFIYGLAVEWHFNKSWTKIIEKNLFFSFREREKKKKLIDGICKKAFEEAKNISASDKYEK